MKNKKSIVALYLNKLTLSQKVKMGNAVHDAIKASALIPTTAKRAALLIALFTPKGSLGTADAVTTDGSHESFAVAETVELQFDTDSRNMGCNVLTVADGQPLIAEEIILSANMKLKKSSVKMKPPSPIEDMLAVITGQGDSIKLLIISGNPRSTHFELLMTTTPKADNSWVSVADTSARRLMVKGLSNGTSYYFKARAINNIGRSIYSDVVSQIAA